MRKKKWGLALLLAVLLAALTVLLFGDKIVGVYREVTFRWSDASEAERRVKAYADENGISYGAYPESLIELLERNPETEAFVLEYPLYRAGSYDLSEFDRLTMSVYTESTKCYNIIVKLMTAEGYYQMRFYIVANGWSTVMLPLKANAENANVPYFKSVGTTTGLLNDVIGIRIEFEGGLAGNGNGKLMDGVSIAFENISFVSNTVRSIASLGETLDVGEFCEKDHKYVDATPVAPTCTSSGYTKRVCSECGHIAVKDIVAPKADVKGTETPISDQTCLTDGIIPAG